MLPPTKPPSDGDGCDISQAEKQMSASVLEMVGVIHITNFAGMPTILTPL